MNTLYYGENLKILWGTRTSSSAAAFEPGDPAASPPYVRKSCAFPETAPTEDSGYAAGGLASEEVADDATVKQSFTANKQAEPVNTGRPQRCRIDVLLTAAAEKGFYHSPGWNRDYPRLRIVTVEGRLAGKTISMPPPTQMTFQSGLNGNRSRRAVDTFRVNKFE